MFPLSATEKAAQGRYYYGAPWVWATAESIDEAWPVFDMGSPAHWQHFRSHGNERQRSPEALADRIDAMTRD